MARILLYEEWTSLGSYADPMNPSVIETSYASTRYEFDTTLRDVVVVVNGVTQIVSVMGGGPPPDFILVGEFWFECNGTTRRGYTHDDQNLGTFYTDDILNADACGYAPPPSCLVFIEQVEVDGDTAAVTFNNLNPAGVIRFSIDNGANWQSGDTFTGLAPGRYTLIVEDTTVAGCRRTVPFEIEAPQPAPPAVPALVFARNPVFITLPASQPHRRLRLELLVESAHGAGDFVVVHAAEQVTGATGTATFRFERELAAQLRPDLPAFGAGNVTRLTGRIRRFRVQYAEVRAAGTLRPMVQLPIQTVLLGGLPDVMVAETDFFGQILPDSKMFLTWQPRTTRLAVGQLAFLDLLLLDESLTAFVVRTARYAAGGALLAQTTQTVEFDAPGMPHLWRVPVRALGGGARLAVQVETVGGVRLSETRLFEFVRDAERPRTFLLQNSLGGFDSAIFTGQLSGKQTVERDVAEAVRAPDSVGLTAAGTLSTWRVTGAEDYTLPTGWLSAEEADWLREFQLSRLVWETVGGRVRALDNKTKDLTFYDQQGGLQSFVLTYRYAFPTNAYGSHVNTALNRPATDAGTVVLDNDSAGSQ